MKQTFSLLLAFALLAPSVVLRAVAQTNEASLIKLLKDPSSSVRVKSDAFAQLKLTGTARCVPAVATFLTDDQLAHSARYVLESLPTSKAERALIAALPRTSGPLRVGVINSLAVRGDSAAVTPLGKLLADSDPQVAIASAEALGHLGGAKSLKLLQASAEKSTDALHAADIDGILACGNQLLDAHKPAEALKVFRAVYEEEKPDAIRVAAFRGVILASGKQGIALAIDAIANGDPAIQSVALLLASQLPGSEMTRQLAELLATAKLPVQLALVQCLGQRKDPVAMAAVVAQVSSADADLRLAAIKALGGLGDDSVVELLADKAAHGSRDERKAAKESLLDLNRGPVTQRMLEMLKKSTPEVETELLLAIGSRGDQSAAPTLFDLAQNGNDAERAAAIQALGALVDVTQVPRMVQMVVEARSDDSRSQAADALDSVYERVCTPKADYHVKALLSAIQNGNTEIRVTLMPICSGLPDGQVRELLRAMESDSDSRVSDAAIHALCDTRDPELLPDLVKLASAKDESKTRELAIRGCVRLTTQEDSVRFKDEKKLETFKAILEVPLSDAEKRVMLSGLSAVQNEQSLALATKMLKDQAVQPEAEQAIIKICNPILNKNPAKVRAALKQVIALSSDADTKKSAQTMLDKIRY